MRRLAFFLAAVVTAAFLCAPATAARRSDGWRTLAAAALARFEAVDPGNLRSAAAADALGATALLHGWGDPRATALLAGLMEQRNPDGGWGIGTAWDAFQDGSTNPATTTYTVTLAGHVGPVLLEGFRAGVVGRDVVQDVVDLLTSTRRIGTGCLAYSRAAADAKTGFCVHNVNAGAAWFLVQARRAGFTAGRQLIGEIAARTAAAWQPGTGFWPYRDGKAAVQDADHNAYLTDSMLTLAPPIGDVSLNKMMAATFADNPQAPLAHMRLTARQCSERWLPEAETYLATVLNDPVRLAQVAHLAARTATACGGA